MTLKVVASRGDDDLARVFVAELADGARIELVEAVQPPVPRADKWVLIVSTLRGCPVGCGFCDAGGGYHGKLSAAEITDQVDWLVQRRYGDAAARVGPVPVRRIKVQFARMGEPALNDAVLDAIEQLDERGHLGAWMPSISTVAPAGRERFFERLRAIKEIRFGDGRMQMQFSLHTTDEAQRRALVPIRSWSFAQMAAWGDRFFAPGDRRITLNFAAAQHLPLEPTRLLDHFDPARYLVKLTPINPTHAARDAGLTSRIDPSDPARCEAVAEDFRRAGYVTLVSIGELRENDIGSNCGMAVADLQAGALEPIGAPARPAA